MNIIVQCDGGLCNRINNLINGIYLSELLNRKLYVWWALNHACNCPLDKLFSNDFNQNYKEIYNDDFVYYSHFNTDKEKNKIKNKYGELKHRLTWRYDEYSKMHNRADDTLNARCAEIITELKSIQSPVLIFSSSLILTEIIPESVVRKIVSELLPVSELKKRMDAEIKNNYIDLSVIGIHLRRTDYHLMEDNYIINSINSYLKLNKQQRFLICSDSSAAEQAFKKLYPDNVIVIGNKSYIEKIDNKKTDKEFSNLMRTEKSVQDALIDMYLLAHSSFEVFSPVSTFAQTVFKLNKIFLK